MSEAKIIFDLEGIKLIHSIPQAIIIIDPKGKILSKSLNLKNFSEALKKLLPAEEVDKVIDFK